MKANLQFLVKEDDNLVDTFKNALNLDVTCAREAKTSLTQS